MPQSWSLRNARINNASLPVNTCVSAASDASSPRITSSMHAMWMRTLPEGGLGLSRFEPVLHGADQQLSICCMEHERDGLLREPA